MIIKRTFCLLMAVLCLISSSIYGKELPLISVTYETLDQELKDSTGVPMVSVMGNTPTISIKDNNKATNKINTFYKEKKKEFGARVKTYFKQAKEDYGRRTDQEKTYWNPYGLGSSYNTSRMDKKVISFIENGYEYAGGAHPNAWRFAQNFNTQTGNRLTLQDVTTDVKGSTAFINNYILKLTKKADYKDYFFEDYEKNIKDILTEDTWYFSDEGLVIICNEYIISPHAVGILEFTIPYSEFPYLKDAYKPIK